MKLKKKLLIGMSVILASSMILTACGGKKGEEIKEDVENVGEDIKDGAEDVKDKVEEKGEEMTDKAKENKAKVETIADIETIIEKNFKKVELKDFNVEVETDNPEKVYIADLYLYIDVEDKDEAEKLIDAYSEILFNELYEKKPYTEATLQWNSPNHDDANQIVKEDFKG